VHLVIKGGLMNKILFLLNGLVISRYACVFWLKNPAAFHDDFWGRFINIWAYGLGFIPQVSFSFYVT
jgi:hypothetical protein